MTVTDLELQPITKTLNGDGVTSEFDFDFKISEESDLKVSFITTATGVVTEKTYGNDNDYTVSINPQLEGGTVTILTAVPTAGQKIFMKRDGAYKQPSDFDREGNTPEEIFEQEIDRAIMLIQQNAEKLSRAVLQAETTEDPTELVFPTPDDGKALLWNADGTFRNSTVNIDELFPGFIPDGVIVPDPTQNKVLYWNAGALANSSKDLDALGVLIEDADGDTGVYTETNPDEDKVRVYAGGVEIGYFDSDGLTMTVGDIFVDGSAVSSNPTGTVILFAGEVAPDGYLILDGAEYERAVYDDLYDLIGDTFGEGDGVTTFNVGDFRGRFPRGWDNGAGLDPDAATRAADNAGGNTGDNIGSVQLDEFKSHTHTVPFNTGPNAAGGAEPQRGSNPPTLLVATTASGGAETRAKNITVNFCIKY